MAVQVVGMVMEMDLGSVEEDMEVFDCWPVVDRVVHQEYNEQEVAAADEVVTDCIAVVVAVVMVAEEADASALEFVDVDGEEQTVSAVSVGFLAAIAGYPVAMHKDKVRHILQIRSWSKREED